MLRLFIWIVVAAVFALFTAIAIKTRSGNIQLLGFVFFGASYLVLERSGLFSMQEKSFFHRAVIGWLFFLSLLSVASGIYLIINSNLPLTIPIVSLATAVFLFIVAWKGRTHFVREERDRE